MQFFSESKKIPDAEQFNQLYLSYLIVIALHSNKNLHEPFKVQLLNSEAVESIKSADFDNFPLPIDTYGFSVEDEKLYLWVSQQSDEERGSSNVINQLRKIKIKPKDVNQAKEFIEQPLKENHKITLNAENPNAKEFFQLLESSEYLCAPLSFKFKNNKAFEICQRYVKQHGFTPSHTLLDYGKEFLKRAEQINLSEGEKKDIEKLASVFMLDFFLKNYNFFCAGDDSKLCAEFVFNKETNYQFLTRYSRCLPTHLNVAPNLVSQMYKLCQQLAIKCSKKYDSIAVILLFAQKKNKNEMSKNIPRLLLISTILPMVKEAILLEEVKNLRLAATQQLKNIDSNKNSCNIF